MRGRGLLIAAAVLQLVGAAVFLITGCAQLVMGAAEPHAAPLAFVGAVCFVVGVFGAIRVHELRNWRMARTPVVAEELGASALAGNVTLGEASAIG
jgi:hypothetical protein